MSMTFECDERKSAANLRERGFDFAYAALTFESPTIEWDDARQDYGERRIQAIGQVEEDILVVVYTWRGAARRIISARLASQRERDAYREAFG